MYSLKWNERNEENHLQYPSNTQNYTISFPYWMHYNLLFNIYFCLKLIIEVFSTIYLSFEVLFPSFPLEGMPKFSLFTVSIMSLGLTKFYRLSLKWRKKGQLIIIVYQQLLDLNNYL